MGLLLSVLVSPGEHMKRVLSLMTSIPGFTKRLALFVGSILLAQGVAIQVVPLVDREIVTLIQDAGAGKPVEQQILITLLVISLLAAVFHALFLRLSYTIAAIIQEQVWNETFRVGFEKLIYHDIAYLSSDRSSTMLNQVNRASYRFSQLFTESASALLRNLTKALVSLIIIFSLHWQIGLMILGTLIAYVVVYAWRFRADIPLATRRDDFSDKEFSRVWEVVPQAKLTKLFTNEAQEVARIDQLGSAILDLVRKRERLWNLAEFGNVVLVKLPTVVIRFYAAWLALQGSISLPNFVLLYTMISAVQEPMWVVSWFMWEMQDTYNRGKKYLEILASKETVTDPVRPVKLSSPTETIRFENVSFQYPDGNEKVLDNLNLTFEGGTMSALVGKSGAGKTTITGLLARFFDPTSGRITIGDIDIRDVKLQDLRSHIGFVMQESYVFSGTIADNLRYARHRATNKELEEALKKAHAWDFVVDFPEGTETEIGERGIKLSGGQRQRLSIARVILKDPAIVILDEATNALDSESEVLVQQALDEFLEGRTVLAIAHRLSTVYQARKIVVLESGQVIEQGTHRQLLAEGGTYKMLHEIQSSGFSKQMKIMQEYEMA